MSLAIDTPLLRREVVRFVVGAFAVSRLVIFSVVALAAALRPKFSSYGDVALPEHDFWDRFINWDSFHYFRISDHGYSIAEKTGAFFPAYPYLCRWLGNALGDVWLAGLLISHLATLGGLIFLYGLAERYAGRSGARRAVLLLLAFPSAFFFTAFYSEGLYFLAVAGALYGYDRMHLGWATAFAFLAILTRPTGMLLLPALALGVLHRHGWQLRHLPRQTMCLLVLPAALVLVMLILKSQVDDPLAFVHTQRAWARKTMFPLLSITHAAQDVVHQGLHPPPGVGPAAVMRVFDLVASLLLFGGTAAAVRRLDVGHFIFMLFSTLMPLSSGLVLSMERFALVVVPLFIVGAMILERRRRLLPVLLISAACLVMRTATFAIGWVAG